MSSLENERKMNNDTQEEEEPFDTSYEIKSWDELDMDNNILRGIYSHGFEKPSPIQQKAIKPIIMRKDIIAQAQSGTGKTAAFTIGALSIIDLNDRNTQVLILSPTRELSVQTASVITNIGSMMPNLKVQTFYGGSAIEEGNEFMKKNVPHIICGCPGRVCDMLRRNKITSKGIKLIILDEADEMLSAGFKEQVYNIFQYLNSDIQVALFSATLPNSIFSIIKKIMRNPVKISVKAEQLTLEGISQFYYTKHALMSYLLRSNGAAPSR
jgi:superfamily II DNA/RNA helicase